IAARLGLGSNASCSFKVKYDTLAEMYTYYFYTGTFDPNSCVQVKIRHANTPGGYISFPALLYNGTTIPYYTDTIAAAHSFCNDNSGTPLFIMEYNGINSTATAGFYFDVIGLDVYTDQNSCITCLEMKKAYAEFAKSVMSEAVYVSNVH